MEQYGVEMVACSEAPDGRRVATIRMRFPKFVLGELARHRDFSLSAESTRATPTRAMLSQVLREPYVPIQFGANRRGQVAGSDLPAWKAATCRRLWLLARWPAVVIAWTLMRLGLAKQWAGRLVEAWSFCTVVVTGTRWENFLALRCHKAAQPEFRKVAVRAGRLLRDAEPRPLDWGQWHLPFLSDEEVSFLGVGQALKVSAARCARTCVAGADGKGRDLQADLSLFGKLAGSAPVHASPTEHQCYPITYPSPSRAGNLGPGWVQHRKLIANETVRSFDWAILDAFPED